MAENSPEKKIGSEKNSNSVQQDREFLNEVLEEIPEMDSVGRSTTLQIILFPLIALILISIIPFLLSYSVFNRTETAINRDFPFMSLESPLLRNAVEDINRKRMELDRKDIQIRRYQDQILGMDNSLRLLQSLMQESLQNREQELLEGIGTIVDEERSRLQALGRTEEDVNRALERLKSNLDSEYSERMDDFRSRELQLYQQRLEGMKADRDSLERALAAAVEERQALARALTVDESDLLARLHEEKEYLNLESAGVKADLKNLRESRFAENYWLEELANQYLGLLEAISVKDGPGAEEHIETLENLFSDSAISELPGFTTRNAADREIVRFFAAYVTSLETGELESILTESRMLIDQAEAHNSDGRFLEAEVNWKRVENLWPLMSRAMSGFVETRDADVAGEIGRYTEIAVSSLSANDFRGASEAWENAMDLIPDPIGKKLREYWAMWESASEKRLAISERAAIDALSAEITASSERYNSMLERETVKRRILQDYNDEISSNLANARLEIETLADELRESDLKAAEAAALEPFRVDNTPVETSPADMVPASELDAARKQIEELQARITLLESRKTTEDTESPSTPTRTAAAQWRLYGIVVQIVGEALIIEPLTSFIPEGGSELRVMRSLGEDRVIHLADGIVIEAGASRASGRLSSGAGNSEIYGSPRVGDLVYIFSL